MHEGERAYALALARPTFATPIIALAAFDFSSPCATLTWLKPNSFSQLSLMRLFVVFMEIVSRAFAI